jgi:hypothetical protein
MKTTLTFLIFSLILSQGTICAQGYLDDLNKGIVYNKEKVFHFNLQRRGYSFGYQQGKIKTYYRTPYWFVNFGELRNSKEFKQRSFFQSNNNISSRSFIYGKQNSLFVLRAGKGQKRYFSEKQSENGVALGFSYDLGFTLGMLKPYYLELFRGLDRNGVALTQKERYSESNADLFLDPNRIEGSGGFLKGWDELSLVPGIHGKLAGHFDWGAYDRVLKAIEVGVMADVFSRTMPMMVNDSNSPVFVTLFVNLQIGLRE